MSNSRPIGRYKVVCIGAAALFVVSLSGCATITRGTHQDWVVTSDPLGANVKTSNGFACDSTPCTFNVPRKPGFDVTVSKPGYRTAKVTVVSGMHGNGGAAMAGNVLVGGIVGGVVDANNGSLNDITPNPLTVKLEKEDATDAQK